PPSGCRGAPGVQNCAKAVALKRSKIDSCFLSHLPFAKSTDSNSQVALPSSQGCFCRGHLPGFFLNCKCFYVDASSPLCHHCKSLLCSCRCQVLAWPSIFGASPSVCASPSSLPAVRAISRCSKPKAPASS